MQISRRSFLYYSAPMAALPLLPPQCSDELYYRNGTNPFLHGVASGDPAATGVILWTRVTADGGAPARFSVRWYIATDPELTRNVQTGVAATDGSVDFTVKIDVTRLLPGTTYYYRFEALGHDSKVGRTRTLPVGQVQRLRLAFTSCANHAYGIFNAYARIAERADLDAVLHLGDYLYEYANAEYGDGTALGRIPSPNREIVSLEDYRQRHAQYKTDADLQEAHRQHPFVVVWDDHESANDAFRDGAQNHDPASEGSWLERRAAAIRAYFEWMPIRGVVGDASGRVYRSFAFGSLADVIMLDTRMVDRDPQVADPCDAATLSSPERQLLGAEQEQWFFSELSQSQRRRAGWRIVGQQVMFAELRDVFTGTGCALNTDQWDGYAAARARVLSTLSRDSIDNVVVLTGDIHSSWANDITSDPFDAATYEGSSGRGSVAVEFVTPAVTSPGIDDPVQAAFLAQVLRQTHPHIKYVDLNRRGYALLDVTEERVQAEWYFVSSITEASPAEELGAAFVTMAGHNHIVPALAPSEPRADAPALAPLAPTTV
ncbi:MAG TPA: alkaline phosphatase D family protein [Polyangiaceae bacterium]|nr:alkaline phosphatase D family protein [Polyangiaceae bacterium]